MMLRDDWEIFVADRDGANERQRHARDPARSAAAVPRPDRLLGGHGRAAAPPVVSSTTCGSDPGLTRRRRAAVSQQHGADDRAGVSVGAQPGRHADSDRRGARRQHGVARARRLPRRSARNGSPKADLLSRLRSQPEVRDRAARPTATRTSSSRSRPTCARSSRASRRRGSSATRRRCSTSTRRTSRGRATARRRSSCSTPTSRSATQPEYQWFEPRERALDGKTANVVATLRGTTNPELVYVVSSHYDSVEAGPGADDDSSGTAALLEAARVLADHPLPATIVFASFTGEEGGLLGSREFVRRAVAGKTARRRRAEQRHGRLDERRRGSTTPSATRTPASATSSTARRCCSRA